MWNQSNTEHWNTFLCVQLQRECIFITGSSTIIASKIYQVLFSCCRYSSGTKKKNKSQDKKKRKRGMYKKLQEVLLPLALLLLSHFTFVLIIKPDLPFSFSKKLLFCFVSPGRLFSPLSQSTRVEGVYAVYSRIGSKSDLTCVPCTSVRLCEV